MNYEGRQRNSLTLLSMGKTHTEKVQENHPKRIMRYTVGRYRINISPVL